MSKVPLELTEQYSNEKQKIKIRLNKNIFIIKIKGTILINNRVVKSKWHTAKYSDPYSESMLYIYPSKCTQTAVNAHTHREHTRSSGQPFMLRRPGSSWVFGVLLKGTSVVVLKVERAVHSFPPPTIPAGPETRTRNLSIMSLTLYH